MGSKKEKQKQNPPPPKPEEESAEEELEEEEVEEDEEEEEEEVEEKEVEEEEEEAHQEKPQPSSSSGSESEAESESADDDDQSSSHQTQLSVKRQATPPPPETVPNSGSEDSDETESADEGEEEEEDPASESPRSATASAYTVKPIATVPVNSKNSKPTPKRALESSKNDKGLTDRKKAKTGEGENDKKGKGGVFPGRVWSEESEIVVLQGLVNYQKERGPFRSADTGIFYEFIKGKLWDGVTKTQIGDKIKRLKTKYGKNVQNGKNGQDPIFSKAHDKKAFELSKQIWGVGSSVSNGKEEKAKNTKVVDIGKGVKKVSNAGSETKRVVENSTKVKSDDPKGKKGGSNDDSALMDVDVDVNEAVKQDLVKKDELKKGDVEGDFLSKFPTLSKSFDAETVSLKDYLHLIGSQNASELEEEWKQLQLEEMNVAAKRVVLKGKQTKLVLDAMKKQ